MNDALVVLVSFVLGCVVTFFLVRRVVGDRRWNEGYFHGFNLAWDEKAKSDQEAHAVRLKKLRKTGPKLVVLKGEKP